jgi:hypothetical protein
MAALSRSCQSSPLGKRTADLRIRVPEATREELELLYRAAGYSSAAEYLAEVVICHVHGPDALRSLYEARVQAVAGKGRERG